MKLKIIGMTTAAGLMFTVSATATDMPALAGGVGNRGAVPMPPNDPQRLHKAEITQLIKFEQGLAKKK